MKYFLTISLLSICSFAFGQDCQQTVIKKHHVTFSSGSYFLRFNITVWGKITQEDVAKNYRQVIPENDFNCLIQNIETYSCKDIVFSVTRKNLKKEQRFDVNVWRALIYQL